MPEEREVRVVEVVRVPAAPLARAAQPGEVLSFVPTTVASAMPPSARTTRRTMPATGSAAPASMTPSVSRRGAAHPGHDVRRAFLERGLDDELGEAGGGAHGRHDIMSPDDEVLVKVRFLGSGDAFGSGGRFQTCIHLESSATRSSSTAARRR